MREHTCPKCKSVSSIMHGNKVLCHCGVMSDFEGNVIERPTPASTVVDYKYPKPMGGLPPEGSFVTMKPVQHPRPMVELSSTAEIHPLHLEPARHMFNFTSPDEKTVEYYIQEQDDKFQIFSKAYPLNKDGTGVAHNYVAEKSTREEAEELIQKIKNLR